MSELYSSPQIDRAYKLIEVLAGHEFDPLTNKEIIAQTGWNGATTTRHCQAAQSAGVVEQTPDGRWRLTPRITRIAVAVQHGIQKAKSRMEDDANNLTRSPY